MFNPNRYFKVTEGETYYAPGSKERKTWEVVASRYEFALSVESREEARKVVSVLNKAIEEALKTLDVTMLLGER